MSARTCCPACGWTRTYRRPGTAERAAAAHVCRPAPAAGGDLVPRRVAGRRRELPARCSGCGHEVRGHTRAGSRLADWGLGCLVAGCGCPEHDGQPPLPRFVLSDHALTTVSVLARLAHRGTAIAEALTATLPHEWLIRSGFGDREAARRAYVAASDLVHTLARLAEQGMMTDPPEHSLLLGVDPAHYEDLVIARSRRRGGGGAEGAAPP